MASCSPTDMLREEHRLILQVVERLAELVARESPADEAVATIEDCVTFFRLYTDACHHGKEEDLLFGSLVDQGMPRTSGPIAVMLQEHEVGRGLVRAMADGIERLRGGDQAAWAAIVQAGISYVDLLRQHIMKENHVLFNMADGMVPEPECRRLCDAYDAVCARRFEGHSLEELEELAARLLGDA